MPVTEANTVILLNQPFRSHERKQAISRVDRIGQDSIVRVWTTLLDTGETPNISTRSDEILEWSRVSVDAIMGIDPEAATISVECLDELLDVEFDVALATDAKTLKVSKENFFFKEF